MDSARLPELDPASPAGAGCPPRDTAAAHLRAGAGDEAVGAASAGTPALPLDPPHASSDAASGTINELAELAAAPAAPPAAAGAAVAYDAGFWCSCLAHAALMTTLSILFRYADFIGYLGGTEGHLGLVVGIGMVGALAMRAAQGVALDRHGPRLVWIASLVLLVGSLLAHLAMTPSQPQAAMSGAALLLAALLRIAMISGTAGAFGASVTFISLRTPEARMPEMVGVMGSSGFLGWILGPVLGDLLFAAPPYTGWHMDRMFLLAAAAAAVSLVCAAAATWREPRRRPQPLPPLMWVVRRYHPGPVLLVGVAMGVGVGLPHTFVRPFAASLDIDQIKVFFVVYALSAFSVRLLTRRFTERLGVRAVNLLGLAAMAASMVLFLPVANQWMLALPALLGGTAHALLFPAVVGGGSAAFPKQFRGVGTTLMLASFDLGCLVGQPVVGGVIEAAKLTRLPPYATMFLLMAALFVATALYYAGAKDAAGRSGH